MICLTQPDKKKLFGGKSETESELYLCTGKQKKKRFRREKLHRRLEIYPKFNASQTLTKKKASQKVLYISVSILPSHVQSFTNFNPKKKKKKKASENKFSFKASLFLSCQNRGISENFILFDFWSFFCIYIVVLVSLYCCFGG